MTISEEQVISLFVIAAVVLILTFLFLRPMYILTFDEDTAFVDGLPVRTMSILFNMVTGWLLPYDSCSRSSSGIDHYGLAS